MLGENILNIIQYLGRGRLHEKKEIPCQDYADYYISDRKGDISNIIMAVSDGCSASKYADIAAFTNVNAVIKLFKKMGLDDFLANSYEKQKETILKTCITELSKEAKRLGSHNASDFCATLVFAVMDKEKVLIGHIGDGAAYCFDRNQDLIYASTPQNGEESNITYFTLNNDTNYLHLAVIPRYQIRNIMICSDGPYTMLKTYGEDHPRDALTELIKCTVEDKIQNCQDLASKVIQMSSTKYEHNDDWSILILDTDQFQCDDKIVEPISMYDEIEKKFEPLKKAYLSKLEKDTQRQKNEPPKNGKMCFNQENVKTKAYDINQNERINTHESKKSLKNHVSNNSKISSDDVNVKANVQKFNKNQYNKSYSSNSYYETSLDNRQQLNMNQNSNTKKKKNDTKKIVVYLKQRVLEYLKKVLYWDD